MRSELPYREGALAFILDEQNRLLLVQLNAYKDDEWNVPGGGREGNESALQNINREITEELGVDPTRLTLLGRSEQPICYDFPDDLDRTLHPLATTFRGQRKDAFVFRCPDELKVHLTFDPNELRGMRWCAVNELESYLVFPGQFTSYSRIIQPFIQPEI